jgi:enoyl-CoA hydratase/carnithine racemase
MLYKILNKIVEWENEPEKAPRAIIMSGAGDVAFCSGGDMRGLYDGNIGLHSLEHFIEWIMLLQT